MEFQKILETYPDGTPKRVARFGGDDFKLDEIVYTPDGKVQFKKIYSKEFWGEWYELSAQDDSIRSGNFLIGEQEDNFLSSSHSGEYTEFYNNGNFKIKTQFQDNYSVSEKELD